MNPLSEFTYDRIIRSNKPTLLKLLFKEMQYRNQNPQDEENLLETAITSILYDSAKDNYEMSRYLIENGVEITNRSLVMAIRAYDQSDLDTDVKVGESNENPSLALVLLLINGIPEQNISGADVTKIDDMGENVLMKTVGTTFYNSNDKKNEETLLKIVKELVEKGAQIDIENCVGESVLSIAEERAPQSIVDYLKSQLNNNNLNKK